MPKRFNPHDSYFRRAKKEGLRARSAFKLEEIQNRHKVLKKGDTVLDLGAAPGSFLQSIRKIVGQNGMVLGVDLQEIQPFEEENVITAQFDITDFDAMEGFMNEFRVSKVDVITADLAPKTTGRKDVDQYKSVELNEEVLDIAKIFLRKNGNLVSKIFTGEDFNHFVHKIKSHFKKVVVYKPKACRDRSKEVFLVGKGFLGA